MAEPTAALEQVLASPAEPNKEPATEPATSAEPPAPEKTFTQKDLDDAISKAVVEARKGWNTEQSQAEKLAKMSEDERIKEQNRLDREKIDRDRAELDRRLLEQEAAEQLRKAGVPDSFADRVCGKDAEETKTIIDAFVKEWNSAISAGVNDKLKGTTPKITAPQSTSMADIIAKSVKQGF